MRGFRGAMQAFESSIKDEPGDWSWKMRDVVGLVSAQPLCDDNRVLLGDLHLVVTMTVLCPLLRQLEAALRRDAGEKPVALVDGQVVCFEEFLLVGVNTEPDTSGGISVAHAREPEQKTELRGNGVKKRQGA